MASSAFFDGEFLGTAWGMFCTPVNTQLPPFAMAGKPESTRPRCLASIALNSLSGGCVPVSKSCDRRPDASCCSVFGTRVYKPDFFSSPALENHAVLIQFFEGMEDESAKSFDLCTVAGGPVDLRASCEHFVDRGHDPAGSVDHQSCQSRAFEHHPVHRAHRGLLQFLRGSR